MEKQDKWKNDEKQEMDKLGIMEERKKKGEPKNQLILSTSSRKPGETREALTEACVGEG